MRGKSLISCTCYALPQLNYNMERYAAWKQHNSQNFITIIDPSSCIPTSRHNVQLLPAAVYTMQHLLCKNIKFFNKIITLSQLLLLHLQNSDSELFWDQLVRTAQQTPNPGRIVTCAIILVTMMDVFTEPLAMHTETISILTIL